MGPYKSETDVGVELEVQLILLKPGCSRECIPSWVEKDKQLSSPLIESEYNCVDGQFNHGKTSDWVHCPCISSWYPWLQRPVVTSLADNLAFIQKNTVWLGLVPSHSFPLHSWPFWCVFCEGCREGQDSVWGVGVEADPLLVIVMNQTSWDGYF